MSVQDKIRIGSETARNGFKNEDDVISKFNDWENDGDTKEWLKIMNYNLNEIEFVKALKILGNCKGDIQVQVSIKLKNLINSENISIKLVSNSSGFNQIDKRWTDKYKELWNIPDSTVNILKFFTGEISPYRKGVRDPRRMFLDEMKQVEKEELINFIKKNKILIISDILKGRGRFSADWMLVILKRDSENYEWALKDINTVMNIFGNGNIYITNRGSLKIGNITVQRKGGDGGRITANMLQFKINPCLLFDES